MKFDKVIISSSPNKYDAQKSFLLELNYEINFAVSTTMPIITDLEGNLLPYTHDNRPYSYISIFPNHNKSFILISWFKEDDYTYSEFVKSINKNSEDKLLIYLNSFIPLFVRNTVISPRLWLNWNEEQRNEYKTMSIDSIPLNATQILDQYKLTDYRKFNYLKELKKEILFN